MFSLVVTIIFMAALTALLILIVVAYFRTGVPTVVSPYAAQQLAITELKKHGANTIYELGSGKGDFVLRLAGGLPEAHVYGFELSAAPYLVSQVLRLFSSARHRVHFFMQDFRKIPLDTADAVVFYLMLHANKKIAPKLERELRPGTLVLSVSFSIADWVPEQTLIADNLTKTRLHVYRMPVKHKVERSVDRATLQK